MSKDDSLAAEMRVALKAHCVDFSTDLCETFSGLPGQSALRRRRGGCCTWPLRANREPKIGRHSGVRCRATLCGITASSNRWQIPAASRRLERTDWMGLGSRRQSCLQCKLQRSVQGRPSRAIRSLESIRFRRFRWKDNHPFASLPTSWSSAAHICGASGQLTAAIRQAQFTSMSPCSPSSSRRPAA